MNSTNKSLTLILILIISISSLSLMMVKPAFAQSIPKPSVPTFTVQYIVYTSYVAPTYTINPYTGQNETTSYGGKVDIPTLEFTIENQPFTPYYNSGGNYIDLYYNFRFKGHFGNEWIYNPFYVFNNAVTGQSQIQTIHSYGAYSGGFFIYYNASESNYTTITFDSNLLGIPNTGQVDFQVQAQIGHIDDIPSGLLAGDFYKFTGESSDWSNTQTLTINNNSNSTASTTSQTPMQLPSPTPTQSPSPSTTPVPEFPSWIIPLPLTIIAIIAGLLVYFKKHKHKAT